MSRRRGEPFGSTILSPYMWRAQKLTKVLPALCMRGLSAGSFTAALEARLGAFATAGLSPTTITRLTAEWEHHHAAPHWHSSLVAERLRADGESFAWFRATELTADDFACCAEA